MQIHKQPFATPANGQIQRIAGSARDAALHEQLYRYAEDLEQCMANCAALEERNRELRDACAGLDVSRNELDELVGHSPDIHLITNPAGVILQCNSAAQTLAPPQRLAGEHLSGWVLAAFSEACDRLRSQALGSPPDEPVVGELHMRRSADDVFPMICAVRVFALRRNGTVHGLHWKLRNITYLRESEFDSKIGSMVFQNTSEGVLITDAEGDILAVNSAFTKITGYSADEAKGRNASLLNAGIQDASFYSVFWQSLKERGHWEGEIFNRRKSGEVFPTYLTVQSATDSDGAVISYVGLFSDQSRLSRAEKRLDYLTHFDTLTGLPNQILLQERLAQALAFARSTGKGLTVISIDLVNFKGINDTLGHAIGDRVLQEVARRLTNSLNPTYTLARIGGDHFVIVAPNLDAENEAETLGRKIDIAIEKPIDVDGEACPIACSHGYAQFPWHGNDAATLLRHADKALYRNRAARAPSPRAPHQPAIELP